MPNIYLEKIALTIEDVRTSRKAGESAERGVRAKGAAVGAVVGGGLGGALAHRYGKKLMDDPIHGAPFRSFAPKRVRSYMAGAGAIAGTVIGAINGDEAVYGHARTKKVDATHKSLNKALTKSAAVTRKQVENRIDSNDGAVGLGRLGGFLGGVAGTVSAVAGVGLHKGMKEHGGYSAARDALKNSYARRKANPEKKIGKGSYLTKLEDIKPSRGLAKHVDASGTARKVGETFGKTLYKGRVAGIVGGLVGGAALGRHVQKRRDAADVSYYQKLSNRNG